MSLPRHFKAMISEFIFDREDERTRIDQFLAKKRPFLVCGPSGVGKSLLLRSGLCGSRSVLYCEDSSTTNVVFRRLAQSLLQRNSGRAMKAFHDDAAIAAKSAVSLKGIVLDALREGNPGAIVTMVDMAGYRKYRSKQHIKISPLYIDYRMQGGAAR